LNVGNRGRVMKWRRLNVFGGLRYDEDEENGLRGFLVELYTVLRQ
jgi:hypothetical protein